MYSNRPPPPPPPPTPPPPYAAPGPHGQQPYPYPQQQWPQNPSPFGAPPPRTTGIPVWVWVLIAPIALGVVGFVGILLLAFAVGSQPSSPSSPPASFAIYDSETQRALAALSVPCHAMALELIKGRKAAEAKDDPYDKVWVLRDMFDGLLWLFVHTGH